jgi:hypothetical protein
MYLSFPTAMLIDSVTSSGIRSHAYEFYFFPGGALCLQD